MAGSDLTRRFQRQVERAVRDMRRLAALAETPEARAFLQRHAAALEGGSSLRKRLTPRERYEQQRRVNPERDDLITAIRKLGGLDTRLESDWDGRLSHLPTRGFGLPAIERPGKGRSLDDLAEVLNELGYLVTRDVWLLSDLLSRAEDGTPIYALGVGPEVLVEACGPRGNRWGEPEQPSWEEWTVDPDTGDVVQVELATAADLERLHQSAEKSEKQLFPHIPSLRLVRACAPVGGGC